MKVAQIQNNCSCHSCSDIVFCLCMSCCCLCSFCRVVIICCGTVVCYLTVRKVFVCCTLQSDHIWYCELCKDGGDLLLCDTCPKSFHKECLKLEIVPDGEWSCPICVSLHCLIFIYQDIYKEWPLNMADNGRSNL